jgi:C4-dicarboxylate transporter, DctQ subunit
MLKSVDMWLTKIINAFLVIILLISSLVMFANVVLRYFFNSGLNGTFELVSLLMVTLTFIGASLLVLDNEHLTMDAVVTIVPRIIQKIFAFVSTLLGIVFALLLLIYSIKVIDALSTGLTPVLQLPASIFFFPVAIGSLITILKYILQIIKLLKNEEGKA